MLVEGLRFCMSQRADLGAKLGAGAGIFALELEIRIGVLLVGIDFHFRRFGHWRRGGHRAGLRRLEAVCTFGMARNY